MKELNSFEISCVSGGYIVVDDVRIITDPTGIPADMFKIIEANWQASINEDITESEYIANMYTTGAYQYVDIWINNPATFSYVGK